MSTTKNAQIAVAKFQTEDGVLHDTKAAAIDHMRNPLILAALNKLTNNADVSKWLLENRDEVAGSFEAGKISRVTKSEKKQLDKDLEVIKGLVATGALKANNFVVVNADAIAESFRWPSVQRMKPEEMAEAIQSSLMALTEENDDLVAWITKEKEAILAAFQAGVVKREVSEKTMNALSEHRAKMAAAKETLLAVLKKDENGVATCTPEEKKAAEAAYAIAIAPKPKEVKPAVAASA